MDFNLDQIVESIVNWASSPVSPSLESTNLTSPSIEPSFFLELKVLLMHFKYVYLDEQETLSVIIGSHLTDGKKRTSCQFLEKIEKLLVGL